MEYLNEPGFEGGVEEDIDAPDFETSVALEVE